MPQKLDAAAAALAIRDDIEQPSAEDRHTETFAKDVASQLGLDHSPSSIAMVVRALHRHDIEPHRVQQYPKHVKNWAGDTVTVHNEDDEKRAGEAPPDDETDEQRAEREQREIRQASDGQYGESGNPKYPRTVMRRGTDGEDHPVMVRDLKEEREMLGLDDSPINPAAPRQSDQADLPEVTQDEIDHKRRTGGGGEMQSEALKKLNEPKAPTYPRAPGRAGPKPAGRPPIKQQSPEPASSEATGDEELDPTHDNEYDENLDGVTDQPTEPAEPHDPPPSRRPRSL